MRQKPPWTSPPTLQTIVAAARAHRDRCRARTKCACLELSVNCAELDGTRCMQSHRSKLFIGVFRLLCDTQLSPLKPSDGCSLKMHLKSLTSKTDSMLRYRVAMPRRYFPLHVLCDIFDHCKWQEQGFPLIPQSPIPPKNKRSSIYTSEALWGRLTVLLNTCAVRSMMLTICIFLTFVFCCQTCLRKLTYPRCLPTLTVAMERIRTVPSYKHSGTRIGAGGTLSYKVQERHNMMRGDVRHYRKLVRCPACPQSDKMMVAQYLFLSRGLYNIATGIGIRKGHMVLLHKAIMNIYRDVVGAHWKRNQNKHICDSPVLHLAKVMPPPVLVCLARFIFFGRTCKRRPRALVVFLDHSAQVDGSWIQLFASDLKWVCQHLPTSSDLGSSDLYGWAQFALREPSDHRSLVSRTCTATAGSHITDRGVSSSIQSSFQPSVCPDCSRSFSPNAAMQSHRARAHGSRNIRRRFALSTSCTVCLLEFHTRDRLVHHLCNKCHMLG